MFFCRDFCRNRILQAEHAHVHCTQCISTWILILIEILETIFQTSCRLVPAESKISSLSTQHVSKKTFKMSNWKFRIYESRQ